MPDKISKIIQEFKTKLKKLYGSKFRRLLLYGSWARGEALPDSDIDLAVVLQDRIIPGREIDRMIDAVTDLNLKYNVLLSIYPVAEENFNALNSPLLLNIRREGIAV